MAIKPVHAVTHKLLLRDKFNVQIILNHLEMASENSLNLNLCIHVVSLHNIQQIGTSSKSPSNIHNELSEYRLKDVNQLR